jgi:hypothetical protein
MILFAPKSRLVTTGDPVYLVGTVLNDGAALDVSTYTIRACVQNGRGHALTLPIAQASTTVGATWASGIVAVSMTANEAAGVTVGRASLELELTTATGLVRTLPLVALVVQPGAMT